MRDMFEGDDDLLRRYLLGELSEPEEESLEQRLLADDLLFEQAEGVEGELLAEYARGELTAAQREDVLRRWSATENGRRRLVLARGLTEIAGEPKPGLLHFASRKPPRKPSSTWRLWVPTAAAAALLAVVGGHYIGLGRYAPWMHEQVVHQDNGPGKGAPLPPGPAPREGAPGAGGGAPAEAPVVAAPAPPPPPPPPPAPVVEDVPLPLTGTTRGDAEARVVVPVSERAQEIRFHLPLEITEYPAYEVAISRAETGKQVFQRRGFKPTGDSLVFQVPAVQMPPGVYQATVHGIQSDGQTDSLAVLKDREFEIQKN